jgi:D-sedoheptulose 7-phosphate isomerase
MEAKLMSLIRSEIGKTIQPMQTILSDHALMDTIERVAEASACLIKAGGKVMSCGNGGSAADSQHLAAELVGKLVLDRPGMPGLALTVDTSALTAVGNDLGYEFAFSRR